MLLGTLIARLENERCATETMEALGNVVLYTEVAAAAERFGETPGEYLAASVGAFSSGAGDEEWMSLVAAAERAADPGRVAIERILRWAMAQESVEAEAPHGACTCGS